MRQALEKGAADPSLARNKAVFHQREAEQQYQLERVHPHAPVADIIEQFWWVRWDLGDHTHTQRNLPDPVVNLTIAPSEAMFTGPVSTYFSYPMTGKSWLFGVKFTPAGYTLFTDHEAKDLVDKRQPIRHWLELDLLAEFSRMKTQQDFQQAAQLIEQTLAEKLDSQTLHVSDELRLVNNMIATIKATPAIQRVEQLAEMFSTNTRQCQRLFSRFIGLSPKWVIRHYRIQEVIAQLNQSESDEHIDWAGLAIELGFSDQAHFIKDFKRLTGRLPGEYRAGPEGKA